MSPHTQLSTLLGKTAYADRMYPPAYGKDLVSFTLDNPGTITKITTADIDYPLVGGCWANGAWWATEYSSESGGNSKIWKINAATGEMILVGSSGVDLGGLEYDDTTGTMFASGSSRLYTIDMFTGNATLVGTHAGRYLDGIACDSKGNLYGEELGSPGSLYAINKTTAELSLIGNFNINLDYGQDMAFDKDEDKFT